MSANNIVHVMPVEARQHCDSVECWCQPKELGRNTYHHRQEAFVKREAFPGWPQAMKGLRA